VHCGSVPSDVSKGKEIIEMRVAGGEGCVSDSYTASQSDKVAEGRKAVAASRVSVESFSCANVTRCHCT
jgi:hypothetical protein